MSRDAFSLAFGVAATTLLSGTLVIAGLKAGISPGVSPLVILFAWGAFSRKIAAGGGTRLLNLAQVAGSAGMPVTVGVMFTAPLVQILYTDLGVASLREEGIELPLDEGGAVRVEPALLELLAEHGAAVPPVDVPTLMLLSFLGALIGFGFVGLGTRRFLTDPTLPAPEARACRAMIETAVTAPGERPRLRRSLVAGLGLSFLAPLLVRLGLALQHVTLFARERDGRRFELDLPFAPIYLGIGGLLTLPVALLVFGGALLRLIGDFLLAGVAAGSQTALDFPANSMRWIGGGAMTVAVAYSLVRFFGMRTGGEGHVEDPLVGIDRRQTLVQRVLIAVGALGVLAWLLRTDGFSGFAFGMGGALLVCCSLMVVLGAILSLQIGASASPVSGTLFVTTLGLCLVALAFGRREPEDVLILTPLLVAAGVAVTAANDASQDYKTMQLSGLRVQSGFLAQFLGLMAGCVAVPIVLDIAHRAYVLGSDDLVAPQGKMFATLIDGLLLRDALPGWPIALGLGLGVLAVLMDVLGQRRGLTLPSMALAVGIYLPAYLGIGILIGSLCRFFAEGRAKQSHESILTAAGLITGAALFELILGAILVGVSGFRPSALALFGPDGPDGTDGTGSADVGTGVRTAVAVVGVAAMGLLLWSNSRPARDR